MSEKPSNSGLIYFDHNATTPVDQRVLESMLPWFTVNFGNAASKTHMAGREAAHAIARSREKLAMGVGAEPGEIIFTSGATESVNMALTGMAEAYRSKGNHIITWATEHKAVIETLTHLESEGFRISILPVSRNGAPDLEKLKSIISGDTIFVALMAANNETGYINPVKEVADIVHRANSILFCDATQAIGKIRFDVNELNIDAACISAHKFYGPKGVGALYLRRKDPRVALKPIMFGGGHEKGIRPGTQNVPGIVGMAHAMELCLSEQWDDSARMSKQRTTLEQMLESCGGIHINGDVRDRLPNTTSLKIAGVHNEQLMTAIPELCISSGSACTSELPQPSHVLKAMGLSDAECKNSIRISLGRSTTDTEIEIAVTKLKQAIESLRTKKV